jgi:hypothetical protein
MTLIERVRRLDSLYLAWDRAFAAWAFNPDKKLKRRERDSWRRYARLRDSSMGLSPTHCALRATKER